MRVTGGYCLHDKIYANSCVEIYRGTRECDQQEVIIKLVRNEHPSAREIASLQHEYHLLKRLKLPGLIRVHDLIESSYSPIMILEYIPGQTLEAFLNRQPLNINRFFTIAIQIVDIIIGLHNYNIVHKDIKPANILIDPSSLRVTLIDLRICSELAEEIQNASPPQILEGTLAYMAPEQTGRMNHPLDSRADLYSLGITFFQMLTGNLPFESADALELVYCHLTKLPPNISECNPTIPKMLDEIINKLLAKTPEERYISAEGLKADLMIAEKQWLSLHEIEYFKLCQYEKHRRLQISHKIYGRDTQIREIMQAFARVSNGSNELILLTGYSGIGKTTLVKEIYKPLAQKKGYFIQGKFDLLQRNIPYSAIISALQELIQQMLAEPETKLAQIKMDLMQALGNIGQVIVDLVPEIEFIIGKQPPLLGLNLTEAQNRFHLAFQNLLRVFATQEHPLIIFIDDLQWADNASLTLLETWLTDIHITHLMIIGAYRDKEVDITHSLTFTLQKLQKSNIIPHKIEVNPLQLEDVQQLLMDSFSLSLIKIEPLARCLLEKTAGNIFFINEFLTNLYQKHLIAFNYDNNEWEWDIEKINQQHITDNVSDLLSHKIHHLSVPAQELLKITACIGHKFNLHTLKIISEQSIKQIIHSIWEAIQANLIIPLNESYRTAALLEDHDILHENIINLDYMYSHDRIQQAVYQLVSDLDKQKWHLQIGRLFLKERPLTAEDERLFEIMNHFEKCLQLIIDKDEKIQLIQYCLWSVEKSKIVAPETSRTYINMGLTLLNDNWKDNYLFLFEFYKALAEVSYLMTQFEQAETCLNLLLLKAKNKIDKASALLIKIDIYNLTNQFQKAVITGLNALILFNIKLPLKPKFYHLFMAILLINWQLRNKNISELEFLPIKDTSQIMISKIMMALMSACYFVNQPLMGLLTIKMVSLSYRYGYNEITPLACMIYAFLLISILEKYDNGFAFVELSNRLDIQLGGTPYTNRKNFIYACLINHWKYPIKTSVDYFNTAYEESFQRGDIPYATYTIPMLITTKISMGLQINEILKDMQSKIKFNNKLINRQQFFYYFKNEMMYLKGDKEVTLEEIKKYLTLEWSNAAEKSAVYLYYLQLLYLLGLDIEAERVGETYYKHFSTALIGQFMYVEGVAFYGLALAATYHQDSYWCYQKFLFKFKPLHRIVKNWAKRCPENFSQYDFLMSAELARIRNDIHSAIKLYDQAIDQAHINLCIHFIAIANERAAKFHFAHNQNFIAKKYLQEAYYAYERWGATTKCKSLYEAYPDCFASLSISQDISSISTQITSNTANIQLLDTIAILKSSQALSSEIDLEKLINKLLTIMLEEAGTQRGVLLVHENNTWFVESEKSPDITRIYLTRKQPVSVRDDLPLSLITYIQRTQETMVGPQSDDNGQTFMDTYLKNVRPKSFLILPLVYQGQLKRILYLENLLSKHIFSDEQLQILKLLASQAAISLENAYSYYLATHDLLTGLANRSLLYQTFNHLIQQPSNDIIKIALLFIDLDHFKSVNDNFGHDIGDKLLIYFSQQLKKYFRKSDLLVRLGGDEFVAILMNVSKDQVILLVDRFFESLKQSIVINDYVLHIKTSMGISFYPNDGKDIAELLRKADTMLYKIKGQGRGDYLFYSAKMD